MKGLGLLASLLIVATSATSRAQTQIKGRVMIMVDTSSSMVWHFGDNLPCGGDGDFASRFTDVANVNQNWYPGKLINGVPDGINSRMYAAKRAVFDAVVSTGNIEFGLMRYAVRTLGGCTDLLRNCCTFAQGACYDPGFGQYIDGKITWWGGCGPVVNNEAVDGGQILVTPAPKSSLETLTWVDNREVFLDRGDGWPQNGELRGQGTTPLAGSARTALNKWYQPIYAFSKANLNCDPLANPLCDPQIDCRPYVFIAMTDGGDSCEGTANLQDKNPPIVAKQLHDVNLANPVLTYVVGLAIVGQGNIDTMNNMAANGGTGAARFANNQAEIEAAFADIVASSVKYELCNGKDDNCNKQIDEGFDVGQNCSVGVGACKRSGMKICDAMDTSRTVCDVQPGVPGPEICNGLDDNCNGLIDEGGVCQMCQPLAEVCQGKDDDCDGKIDDAPIDVDKPCGLNLGICKPGVTVCVNGNNQNILMGGLPDAQDHLICQGAVTPKAEICNNLDDDCDGIVDGMTRPCYGGPMGTDGVGVCHAGQQRCLAGLFGVCVGELRPAPEICNGLDDDCNGKVDDVMGAGAPCCPSGKCGTGICMPGTMQCSGGGLACIGGQGPFGEVCNGIDDDCNGKVDDLPGLGQNCVPKNGCAGIFVCDIQQMQVICQPGGMGGKELCNGRDDNCNGLVDEEPDVTNNDPAVGKPCGNPNNLPPPCQAGKTICKNGMIVCDGAIGPGMEVCDAKDNDCDGNVDDMAPCPPQFVCYDGECDPTCQQGEFPCPGGFSPKIVDGQCLCVADRACNPPCVNGQYCDPQSGQCVDKCANVTCTPPLRCDQGACYGCEHFGCATCQRCDRSSHQCVDDKCCNVACEQGKFCDPLSGECTGTCPNGCPDGQYCSNGTCVEDKCAGKRCPDGEACDPDSGLCGPNPCAGRDCGASLTCCGGACRPDPCLSVKCPAMTTCRTNPLRCGITCEPMVEVHDQIVGAGGGGFACSAAPRPGSARPLLILLGLAALLRFRRRR